MLALLFYAPFDVPPLAHSDQYFFLSAYSADAGRSPAWYPTAAASSAVMPYQQRYYCLSIFAPQLAAP
jgi:hypothetical protein